MEGSGRRSPIVITFILSPILFLVHLLIFSIYLSSSSLLKSLSFSSTIRLGFRVGLLRSFLPKIFGFSWGHSSMLLISGSKFRKIELVLECELILDIVIPSMESGYDPDMETEFISRESSAIKAISSLFCIRWLF